MIDRFPRMLSKAHRKGQNIHLKSEIRKGNAANASPFIWSALVLINHIVSLSVIYQRRVICLVTTWQPRKPRNAKQKSRSDEV